MRTQGQPPSSVRSSLAPAQWRDSCTYRELSLHQLSPYIGKIKSAIAATLIEKYTKPGDLVVDPFAGAGTIPLEAAIRGRRVFASDVSPYARVIAAGKLRPPRSLADALLRAESALKSAEMLPLPDLRHVPKWVRSFFHPKTLKEALRLASVIKRRGDSFLFSCLLGILHHQRPGFLSYPSSNLVPYLRTKKFPRSKFPEMYEYRDVRSRLLAKVERSYRRFRLPGEVADIRLGRVENIQLPDTFDAVITSPPYMNALDYGRDNRLRLWFVDTKSPGTSDSGLTGRRKAFDSAIKSLAKKIHASLKSNGYCIFIVGEEFNRNYEAHPSDQVICLMRRHAPDVILTEMIADEIPDVRRARRECRGVKREHVLVFKRN
jgi:hypothetical protein